MEQKQASNIKKAKRLTGLDPKFCSRFKIEFLDKDEQSLGLEDLEKSVMTISGYSEDWSKKESDTQNNVEDDEDSSDSIELMIIENISGSVRKNLLSLSGKEFVLRLRSLNGKNEPVDCSKFLACTVRWVNHGGYDVSQKSEPKETFLSIHYKSLQVE